MRNKGFTMIELVMVIVILAILAAVAIPRFIDLKSQADESAEAGVLGGVRAGISTFYIEAAAGGTAAWPDPLDGVGISTAATVLAPFFTVVLEQGITSGWTKGTTIYIYINDATDNSFTYDPGDGAFVPTP